MKTMSLAFLAILTVLPVFAQTDQAQLDRYFDTLEANNKFMGNVLIRRDGIDIYSRSAGFADVASGKKNGRDSRFRIGSISKMFTAAMVLKAVEEKKIQLSDLLSKFYPEVPNASKITVEQMLGHRSGIHSFTSDEAYFSYYTSPRSESQMLELISQSKPDFEPGSAANYSNANYYLLSLILQKVYKKPFSDILRDKITGPLKLHNTIYGSKIDLAKNDVHSFEFKGRWEIVPETDPSVPMGAGAIVSTTSDLAGFIEGLFAGKIISTQNVARMGETRDNYGLGMFRLPFGDKWSFGHTGGIDGFSSILVYFPEEKVTLVQLSNGSNFDTNDVSIASLNFAFGIPVTVPEFKTYEHSAEDLEKLTGVYASAQFPLKITVSTSDKTLMAQATGQQAFPLEAVEKNVFRFDAAGIQMEFSPETSELTLKQGGMIVTFRKG